LKRSQKLVRARARMFRLRLRQELGAGSPRLGPEHEGSPDRADQGDDDLASL
jgi:hypothetical protein